MKVINFKNSNYYKRMKQESNQTFLMQVADVIEKNLNERISFGLRKDSEGKPVFCLTMSNRFILPDFLESFATNEIVSFLIEESKNVKSKAEKIMLEAFAEMYQEATIKRTTKLKRHLNQEEVVAIGQYFKEHPELHLEDLSKIEFHDELLEIYNNVEIVEKFPVKIEYENLKNYQCLLPDTQRELSSQLNKLFANLTFGVFVPPADDSHFILKGFAFDDSNPYMKGLILGVIEQYVQEELHSNKLSEKEKVLLCVFNSMVEDSITNNKSYSSKRMTPYEMSVVCNPGTKPTNIRRDGKDDK